MQHRVAGVGGTGVLTIGALLGMAAHIEGKASMILDMSGLAQKGGAVLSHVRLSQNTEEVTCSRIVTGTADVLLAADEVVAVSKDAITLCDSQRTVGVINTHLIPIADFIRNRDFDFQRGKVNHVLEASLKQGSTFFDFTHVAESLLGDSIATNMMMMGYAYQQRPAAGQRRGDRAGDRRQRRVDQDEHRSLPAWAGSPSSIRRGLPRCCMRRRRRRRRRARCRSTS